MAAISDLAGGLEIGAGVSGVATLAFMLCATFGARTFSRLLVFMGCAAITMVVCFFTFNVLWEVLGEINANFRGDRLTDFTWRNWLRPVVVYIVWASLLVVRQARRYRSSP